jgi:hypothetical protein
MMSPNDHQANQVAPIKHAKVGSSGVCEGYHQLVKKHVVLLYSVGRNT